MVANSDATSKPIVVISCPPYPGHTNPLIVQATHLVKRGYEVHFIAGPESETSIRKTGATFYPVQTTWNDEKLKQMLSLPEGPGQFVFGLKGHFIDLAPNAMNALKGVLEDLREKYGTTRDIVILQETVAMGALPFLLGAPLPKGYTKFPNVISLRTVPLTVSSIDTAPFGPGLPPDSSEEGRVRNTAMYEAGKPLWADVAEYTNSICGQLGATAKIEGPIMDFFFTIENAVLQPCSPSLEYPRSDLPKNIRFIGAPPRKEIDPETTQFPEWWDELLTAKKDGKKVVFVTQGTFVLDFNMLLKPTIEALADREDVFVVGVLGKRGATLDGFGLPGNTRIVDYLLYDAVLPYADVFVSNAGYGGFLHSVMHGVPMVLAGRGRKFSPISKSGLVANR